MKKAGIIWILMVFLVSSTFVLGALDDNLTHTWKLDEGSGSAIDTVGTEDGTANSIGNYSNSGMDGTSVYFDQSAGFAMGSTFLSGYSKLTICVWNKPSSLVPTKTIINWANGANTGYIGYYIARMPIGGTEEIITGLNTLPTYEWNFMCIRYDGSDFRFFANGQENGTAQGASGVIGHDTAFGIGSVAGAGSSNQFLGLIDEVYIWGRNLSDTEINVELYNGGTGKFCSGDPCSFVEAPSPLNITTTLIYPANNTITKNQTINITYNITSALPLDSCKLLSNFSGSWIVNATDNSPTNNSNNSFIIPTLNEGNYNYNVNCTNNQSNSSMGANNFTLTVDITDPTVTSSGIKPVVLVNGIPVNSTWSINLTDNNPSECWYWSNENTTNITVTCNTTINTTWTNKSYKTLYFCGNDTAGNQACGNKALYVHGLNWTQNQSTNTVGEGDQTTFSLILNMTGIGSNWTQTNATLNLNNTAYTIPKYIYTDSIKFSYIHTWGNNSGNTSGINHIWNWTFFVKNSTFVFSNYTTTNKNLTVYDLDIDDCSSFTELILNYTIYDETTKLKNTLLNTTIEADITITKGALTWEYSLNSTGNLAVCIPSGTINTSSIYYLYTIIKYAADDHAIEYNYLDKYNLTAGNPQHVALYTLNTDTSLSEYSTSFLVGYQDSFFLPVNNAVVDLLRFYVNEGTYISVDNGKTDSDGNTRLHFVTEDVKYKVVVRKNNEILFQSSPFLALCQTTPCQISFNEESTLNEVSNYTLESNLDYLITLDETTRTVTASFSTLDGSTLTFILRLVRFDGYNNYTVCNESIRTSGGSLSCTVPAAARNTTYLVEFYTSNSPENWVTYRWFSLNPHALDTFGYTGVIMTVLLYLTLVFMAIPSGGIAVVVFGIIGLILAMLLTLFTAGSIFGAGSSIMWLIVAGTIIIFKASKRRG